MRVKEVVFWGSVATGLAAALWMAVQAGDGGTLSQQRSSSHQRQPTALHAPTAQREAAASIPPANLIPQAHELGTGSGLSPEELKDLRAELANHPDGEAEVRRVLGFLSFNRQWEAFKSARRDGASTVALRPLAQALDAQLAQHWAQGALTGAQALQLKAQLLDVLLPDEPSRSQALGRWQTQIWPARAAAAAPAAQLAQQTGIAQ
jgi:hypothetical protein